MLDVSLFFHECSVFTSKLDPNYNLVYNSIHICLFILSYYIVSLLGQLLKQGLDWDWTGTGLELDWSNLANSCRQCKLELIQMKSSV